MTSRRLTRVLPVVGAIAACVLLVSRAREASGAGFQQDSRPAGLAALAEQAVSPDAVAAKRAIERLRAAGPAGLQALLDANAGSILRRTGGDAVAPSDTDRNWPRVKSAIDAVAAQRDAYASGLYWYTDLDA